MKKCIFILLLVWGLCSMPLSALTIKLGSPLPEGSAWDLSLKKMGAEWREITNKKVNLRIYPGGIAGSEGDMIRKMKFGQLDAAVLTIFGMKTLVPNSFVMAMPGILESEEELDAAIQEFAPRFDAEFAKKGFQVLAWSKSGWIYFYSKNPAKTPELLQKEKLSINNTDKELATIFKTLNFNVVPMALNEVIVALQSGMATAVYSPPVAAAAYQWFPLVPNMIDYKLAPVIGGFVISGKTWNRIPEQYRDDMLKVANRLSREFYEESERLNEKAMNVMDGYGLEVINLSGEETEEWQEIIGKGHALLVGDGKWIDDAVYDDFEEFLENIREDR